jgi:hypothetical protein
MVACVRVAVQRRRVHTRAMLSGGQTRARRVQQQPAPTKPKQRTSHLPPLPPPLETTRTAP